jgi:dihydrodipicolinate synthase/N-acetylneuraminate lyase
MDYKELKKYYIGVVVTPITPFKQSNFDLDGDAWRKFIRFLIDTGIKKGEGVIVGQSSTGEFDAMSVDERKTAMEIAVDEAKDEVPFIAGINSTDPKISIELAKHAEQIGAAGLMFGPPYYDAPTADEIVTFYKMVADATNLGICIYNNYFATQADITLEILEKLVNEVDTIIGIKEPVADFEKIEHEIKLFGDRINILTGRGDSFEPYGSLLGVKGFVAYAYVNFLPQVAVEIWEDIKRRDWLKAKELEDRIYKVRSFMFKQPRVHYVSRAKAGMELMGLNGGTVRPFRHPISSEEKEQLKSILKELGYLS